MVYVGAPGVVESALLRHDDNDHYEELEEERADLSNPAALLQAVSQSGLRRHACFPARSDGRRHHHPRRR